VPAGKVVVVTSDCVEIDGFGAEATAKGAVCNDAGRTDGRRDVVTPGTLVEIAVTAYPPTLSVGATSVPAAKSVNGAAPAAI